MGAARRPLISAAVAVAVVVAFSLVAAAQSTPQKATVATDPSVTVGTIFASGILATGHTLPIVALSWSGTSTFASAGSGGGVGKLTLQPFTVTRQLDQYSTLFFTKFLQGAHLQAVVVDVWAPGSSSTSVEYTLSNVVISSFHHYASGTPDYAMPLDRFTLRYKKACMQGFAVGGGALGASPAVCVTHTP